MRNRLSTILWVCGQCVLTLAFAAGAVHAQSGAGSGLSGHVADSSGASMAGVTVTVARPEAGFERTTSPSAAGDWEARFLPPGNLRHHVRARRIQDTAARRCGRHDRTDGDRRCRARGRRHQRVGRRESGCADGHRRLGRDARTLDRRELEALPTSARNITQLLAIEPGVSADISELLSNDNASISPSVNGARTTNNSFVFNGIDVTNMLCCSSRINGSRGTIDAGGGTLSRNIAPAPETLEEVKLQTSLYDASTGRNGGGIFQVVSKSGTNALSGTAYHYFQHDALLANDYFFNRAGTDKPRLRRNEGGFTLGGPVRRNRTFFFGSYQATRAEHVVRRRSQQHRPAAASADRRSFERRQSTDLPRRSGIRR